MEHRYYFSEKGITKALLKMQKSTIVFKNPIIIDGVNYLGVVTYNSPLPKKVVEELNYKEVAENAEEDIRK